jgi:hypothetical protein
MPPEFRPAGRIYSPVDGTPPYTEDYFVDPDGYLVFERPDYLIDGNRLPRQQRLERIRKIFRSIVPREPRAAT